jgi:hypothetical protein
MGLEGSEVGLGPHFYFVLADLAGFRFPLGDAPCARPVRASALFLFREISIN